MQKNKSKLQNNERKNRPRPTISAIQPSNSYPSKTNYLELNFFVGWFRCGLSKERQTESKYAIFKRCNPGS